MALGQNAQATKDFSGAPRVLFTGVAPVKVLAINPTKKQLEEIYGRDFEKEPEYLSADENNVKKLRIDFILQTVKDDKLGVNIEEIVKHSFFLEDRPNIGKTSGKYQVVNVYGEFSWGTPEEVKAGKLAANLSFYPIAGMRPAYVGEEDLTAFVRYLFGVPDRQAWNNDSKSFVDIKDIKQAEGRLDNIKKYFTGDISEITSVAKILPDNKVKLISGIKTTDDNKQYQAFAGKFPIRYSGSDKYAFYNKKLQESIAAGAYANVDFGPEDLKFRIYNNTPTSFDNKSAVGDDPFATAIATGVPANAAASVVNDDPFGAWPNN